MIFGHPHPGGFFVGRAQIKIFYPVFLLLRSNGKF